eukprot:gene25692-32179_t
MNRSNSSKGTTPTVSTGRRTPSSTAGTFGRPPSPKVDLTNKKASDSKPSPSPKQQLGRSLTSSRKSPSNIAESNFVSHERALRKVHSSYNENHQYRHDDADTEQSSVRSVLNEGQLAKIKLVVDHQKSQLPVYVDNDHEPEQIGRQFHSVSNVRSTKVDHDMEYNTYRDSFAEENYYGDSRGGYADTTFNHSFDDGRDDCAVSDITTEAVYMSINESRKIPGVNNSQMPSSGASVFEPSSLPDLPDSEIDHMMKVLAEEKARRALQQQQQQQQLLAQSQYSQSQHTANVINNAVPADAASIRKNVKRAKSGGNEAMMTKKNSSSAAGGAANGGIKGTLPSFHTYRQRLDAGDASVVSQSEEESCHSQSQPQHHHQFEATIDWEVERALQGLQQPVRSASPAGLLSHSAGHTHSQNSPAGVTSAPHSRGTTLSRGSGAYVPADKMWSESSPSHYSSPLSYVGESPNTTSGMAQALASGRLTADPLRDCNSRGPRMGRPDSSDIDEHHSFSRQSSGNNSVHKTRALESFREAKQYSNQHVENIKQQVVHVERFMPLDATTTPSGSSHGKSSHGSSHHSSPRAKQETLQIVRPIIRSSSISSDISSVDGLSFHSQGQSKGNVGGTNGAFTAAANSETRAKDMKATYDALLNREFLVSPLSAFDDASHGSWSVNSGRSRRSSTSTTHKTNAKQPHYMAPKGPHTALPKSTHGSGKHGTPVKAKSSSSHNN